MSDVCFIYKCRNCGGFDKSLETSADRCLSVLQCSIVPPNNFYPETIPLTNIHKCPLVNQFGIADLIGSEEIT